MGDLDCICIIGTHNVYSYSVLHLGYYAGMDCSECVTSTAILNLDAHPLLSSTPLISYSCYCWCC